MVRQAEVIAITLGLFAAAYLLAPNPTPSPPTPPTTTLPPATSTTTFAPNPTPIQPTFGPTPPPTPLPTRGGVKPTCPPMMIANWILGTQVAMNGTGFVSWLFGSGSGGILMNSYDNAVCQKIPNNTRISDGVQNRWRQTYGCDGYCWMKNRDDSQNLISNETLAQQLSACMAANASTGFPAEMCCDYCGPAPHEVRSGQTISQYCGLSQYCKKYTPPAPSPTPVLDQTVHWWSGCYTCKLDPSLPVDLPPNPSVNPNPVSYQCFHDNMTSTPSYWDPAVVFPYYTRTSDLATDICISMGIEAYATFTNYGPNYNTPPLFGEGHGSYAGWWYYAPMGSNEPESFGAWANGDQYTGVLDCSNEKQQAQSYVDSLWSSLHARWPSSETTSVANSYAFIRDYDCARKDAYAQDDYYTGCRAGLAPYVTAMDAHSAPEINLGYTTLGHYNVYNSPETVCNYDPTSSYEEWVSGWFTDQGSWSLPLAYSTAACEIPINFNVDQTQNMFNVPIEKKPNQAWASVRDMCTRAKSSSASASKNDAFMGLGVACAFNIITNTAYGKPYVGSVSIGAAKGVFCPRCWCRDSGGKAGCEKVCPSVAPPPTTIPTPAPTPLPGLFRPRARDPVQTPMDGPRYNQPPDPPFFFRAARFVEKKTGMWSWVNNLHK